VSYTKSTPKKEMLERPLDCNIPLRTAVNSQSIELIRQRITSCKDSLSANCAGTALYIVGEISKERFLERVDLDYYLSRLKPMAKPIEGCLVTWEFTDWQSPPFKRKVSHIGVITSTAPLLVTNRNGKGGKFIENQPFREANRYYGSDYFNVFYLPRILDGSNSNP
jgi:hypothetical protein